MLTTSINDLQKKEFAFAESSQFTLFGSATKYQPVRH